MITSSRWMNLLALLFFPWRTAKHVTRDPAPVAADFNSQDYITFVAHPSSFRKFLEAFLCLVGLSRHYTLDDETYPQFLHKNKEDIFAFIHTPDPTKVKVVEASDTVVEVVAPMQSRRQGKRKSVVVDAGGASHPPKKLREHHETRGKRKSVVVDAGGVSHPPRKLREDHETPSGTSVGGKSRSAIKRLLARAVLNAEVGVAALPTLPFVTAFVSSMPEREAGGIDPTTGVFSDRISSDFLVGAIRTVIDPDTDLQKVYVPQLSMTNGSRLDDGRFCREMVDEFAPPMFFASVRVMEHDQLFTEFNDEMDALKERNAIVEKERDALDAKVTELEASAMSKERELTNLNALVTSVKSRNDNLVDRLHELEISSSRLQEKVTVYQNCMEQLEKFQDDQMKVVNDKFDKLYTDFVEMALHLEEKFYPHLLTNISDRRWLLTQGMKLAIIKCLNSPEYLSVGITKSVDHFQVITGLSS
ncbi:hypothetical protein Tco_1335363 [Tanacetum coccineum]